MMFQKRFKCVIVGFVLVLFSYFYLICNFKEIQYGWETQCALVSILIMLYTIFVWDTIKMKFYSPLFFILLSLFVFHLGNVVIIGFDNSLTQNEFLQLYRNGSFYGFRGTFYCVLFIEFFIIGIAIFGTPHLYKRQNSIVIDDDTLIITNRIGRILFGISILPTLYHDISQMVVKMSYGYEDLMTGNHDFTFYGLPLGYFTKLFLPSICIILCSYKNDFDKFRKIAFFAILYFSIMLMFSGRRGNSIQSFIPIIFIYCYFLQPKFRLIYIFGGYLALFFVSFVSNTRGLIVDEFYLSNLEIVIKDSEPIRSLLLEMGGTIKTPIQAIMAIPSTGDYQYGWSYVASFFYSISCGLHIPIESLKSSALFNEYLSLPERGSAINATVEFMGGSIIAEWYWNFGWVGIPLSSLLAYVFCKYEKKMLLVTDKPIGFALYVCSLYYLTRWSRGYFCDVVWQTLYIVLFLNVFLYFFYKKYKKILI